MICKKFTDEELIDIYNKYYKNGISTVKIGEMYNINSRNFRTWFKKLGLEMRTNKINSRKYKLNDNYFEKIDTKDKAYWLGFIYADGYVSSSNGKRVGITLSIKDKDHLQAFKQCIDANYPIKEYTAKTKYNDNTRSCRILVSSDKMYDDLVKHGVVEHKTNILNPPNIDDKLIKYFILGYFDGDGSIYYNHSQYPFYSISFCATDGICNFINSYFVKNNLVYKECKIEKRKEGQIVSYIRFGGNIQVERILNHLYDGVNLDIVLKRKYELYINCKNRIFV